ncbi:uncharacterized protein yonA [Clostridium botulinum B str. Osaka05]|uniref:Uncharacterized protein yonA n=1 Tax=Clostridium botulinum B str. Osaka05 TaxID=1407017 RepID=A0A060N9J6_CLOBO|nr:hypothetical protein [Clostridium botulinum]BAO04899.1 uncharacterized protein yonA [Clostridium botulinum B str. Osaka05]
MEENKIKVARYKNLSYGVYYEDQGIRKPYIWSGSKGKLIDTKEIPETVVNWLIQNSNAFDDAELVIIEDTEQAKEIVGNIENIEEIKENIYTRKQVEEILAGNFMKMKSDLEKVTLKTEKDFICRIAKEIGIDSVGKQKFLAEWAGKKREVIFEE